MYQGYSNRLFLKTVALFSVLASFTLSKVKNVNQFAVFLLFLIPAVYSCFSENLFLNPNLWGVLALISAFAFIKGKLLYTYD